jgi:sugar porter (SP) family MFS transporter
MNNINKSYVFAISMVSAMGGLLFGYDWVVIGGAKPFYERFFDIANLPSLQAWAMSSALIGCIAGALFSGLISDRYGRKLPLVFAAFLFTLSALGTGLVSDFSWFIVFRIVGGVGIGLASALSPMYIAEVAPAKMRGGFVSLNQFTIVVGILAAQIINMLIADKVPADATDTFIKESWNGQMGWRWMFMAEAVPAVLFFVLVMLVPESPRWLVKAGRADKALPTLARIGGAEYARTEIENIRETLNNASEKVSLRELFKKSYRPILFIGVFLAVFQQWSGLNTVFNYADEIFRAAGYGVSDTLFNIVITGSVNLVFTLVAMFTVDKWGRKKLMLFGAAGLTITYILLGSAYFFELKGVAVLSLVVIAIGVYAMSLAPVVWVILSEIFPNRIRGAAMALATFALWVACFILTYTFPLLNASLGASGTFWVYAAICLVSFVVILIKLPETKGKSLEELEKQLMK